MPTPILFDMDGVILEGPRTDPQVYAEAADEALAELGADPTPAQRSDLRRNDLADVRHHCDALGIGPERFWELKEAAASRRTNDRVRSGERGIYDDVDAIAALADRTTVGLVTNNRQATADFVADDIAASFDVVRGRQPTFAEFRSRKPDPTFLEDALGELGATGDEGVYVGDSSKDVTAGHAAGLETVFLRRPHNRDVELPEAPTAEIESLSELPELSSSLVEVDVETESNEPQ